MCHDSVVHVRLELPDTRHTARCVKTPSHDNQYSNVCHESVSHVTRELPDTRHTARRVKTRSRRQSQQGVSKHLYTDSKACKDTFKLIISTGRCAKTLLHRQFIQRGMSRHPYFTTTTAKRYKKSHHPIFHQIFSEICLSNSK